MRLGRLNSYDKDLKHKSNISLLSELGSIEEEEIPAGNAERRKSE